MPVPDISKLKVTLQTSGLAQKNQPLFQVIWSLIEFCQSGFQTQDAAISGGGGGGGLANQSYVTVNNDLAQLPNSRQVVAGSFISLDTTTPGQIIINNTGGPDSGYWAPLTDGDTVDTDLIFADGECVMVFVPTP